jgi:di/tricarboxylate transporter
MTVPQFLAFSIMAAAMGLFVWGRLRFDLVALLALLAAIAIGIVPPDKAFSGFSDDIVIIVASALLVSAAVERSGVVEDVFQRISPYLTTTTIQVAVLVGTVTVLSGFVKNIGALTMLMPVVFFIVRRTESTPSNLRMPMAFGSLLGGIVTLIGTSPNIIVAREREQIVGEPFSMFDFTPGRDLHCLRGRCVSHFCLAAPAARPQACGIDGCGFHFGGIHCRGARPEGLPCHRQDGRPA